MRLTKLLLTALFAGFITTSVCSQTQLYQYEMGFKSDNDAYLGIEQDKYYTNGLSIFFRGAMNKKPTSTKIKKRTWEVGLDQKMYTPQSAYAPNIAYIDRPFAGYLCASGSLARFYQSENIFKTSVQLGVIGPAALAEETQTFLHQIAGFYTPLGWQTQVRNQLVLNTTFTYNHFLYRTTATMHDASGILKANIGTTFTDINAGLLLRLGKKLNPLFSSASTDSKITADATTNSSHNKEFFLYAKPIISYRFYDATVEGELSSDAQPLPNFNIKPWVFSQELGVTYAAKRWTANFSVIFKTKEIASSAKTDQYGSISAFYRLGQL